MLSEAEIRSQIASCLNIIEKYRWLLDSYMIEFFVEDHWSRLPPSWSSALEAVDPSELADALLGDRPPRTVLPLSLLALMRATSVLSLRRTPIITRTTSIETKVAPVPNLSPTKRSKLENALWKRIKAKKRHEISRLAELVDDVARRADCRTVVDVGSGLGHLARTLAYKHGMRTICVEAQPKLTEGAKIIDEQLAYTAAKYFDAESHPDLTLPLHLNMTLTEETEGALLTSLGDGEPCGVVGLHTCGDLGPLLVRIFCENRRVKFVCAAGCCYMKLTCDGGATFGYPMSEYACGLKGNFLSRESRELACHALENYSQRLRNGAYEDLQIHCYRAALEKIIVKSSPHTRRLGLRSVKHYNALTFRSYCKIALEKIDIHLDEDELNTEDIVGNLKNWKRVVIFYTLRLILAPLVETVVLLDRMLYLVENGIQCEIVPLFDPSISPRNHILVAHKV